MKPDRTLVQSLSWWWNTRIKSWWSVKLPAARVAASMAVKQANNPHSGLHFEKTADELPAASEQTVTAILTVYKRGQYLSAQIDALKNQSVPPDEIWVWCNSSDTDIQDYSAIADRVVVSNTNWKFWGRFAMANMARTQYVCLFDDDILPQPNWIKNCLDTFKGGIHGILGGSGVILPVKGGYSSKHKVGWNGHHYNEVTQVDLVGHAWFFDKRLLRFMWEEPPHSWENGEDIHFSAMVLKHGGLGTYVPPHPENDHSLWSCRPDFGKAVGRESSATFKSTGHHNVRDHIVDSLRANGWKLVAQQHEKDNP